jgi:uncharacterized protein YbaR (Trm112 family)
MSAPRQIPEPSEIPACPVCGGRLDLVYDRLKQKVYVCVDCHAGITIPDSAWEIVHKKRKHEWPNTD